MLLNHPGAESWVAPSCGNYTMNRLTERGMACTVLLQGLFLTKRGEKATERLAMEAKCITTSKK